MWVNCCSSDTYGNYDGFSDDDSQPPPFLGSSVLQPNQTTSSDDSDTNLTPSQQMTFFALVTIPPLALAILLLLCYLWCRKLIRNHVPSYLSPHFPLYDTGEDNTPVLERRRGSSVPKQPELLRPPAVPSSCPTIINWQSKEELMR